MQHVPMYTFQSGGNATKHGYIEFRFRVRNTSASATRRVSLQLAPSSTHLQYGLRSGSGYVEVPPGQTAHLRILHPPLPHTGGMLQGTITIDGRTQRDKLHINDNGSHCTPSHFTGPSTGRGISEAHIMVSIKTPTVFRDLFSQGLPPDPSRPESMGTGTPGTGAMSLSPTLAGALEIGIWRSESDVDQWSEQWLAFSRFDAVLLTDSELKSMPQPMWTALRRYVECGGTLCVIGNTWSVPKEWVSMSTAGNYGQYGAVFGNVYIFDEDSENSKEAIHRIRGDIISRAGTWSAAMECENPHYYYGGSTPGFFGNPDSLSKILPVSHSTGVPVRAISILIIVFAVLIGPVNIYVLSIRNRRIWLLWTVPAISIVASVLVLGTNFLQEGFVRNGSSSTITVLDQRRGESISFGVIGFYSTLTPRSGVEFASSTEATLVGGRNSRKFDLFDYPGGEQIFTGGWIQPRVPGYFGIRKAESRKERMVFQWEETEPSVVNQIGVDIRSLTVCSPDGTFYKVSNLKAGEKMKLVPSNQSYEGQSRETEQERIMQKFRSFNGWGNIAGNFETEASQVLFPGSYLAVLENQWNPFLEPGIEGNHLFENKAVVLGYFQEK